MSRVIAIALAFPLMILALGCSGGGTDDGASVGVSNVRVYGTITYEDKEYGSTGFTNTIIIKPVRGVLVEAVDANTGIASGTCISNSSGGFDITFSNPSGNGFYLRAVAATASPGGPDIRIYSSTLISSVIGPEFTLTSGQSLNQDIAVSASGPMGGAFNILDIMASASAYVNSLNGSYPSTTLKVYWQQYRKTLGTYYCYGHMAGGCNYGEGIYVISGNPAIDDTDEYDDDVLMHEFSHYVGRYLSREDSLGGGHLLSQNDQDPRLSWAEGWGDHMPGAIKKWLAADAGRAVVLSNAPTLPLTQYVDTWGASSSYISFDFNNPGSCSPSMMYCYSTSEVAVAALMAALENSVGTQAVWDVYTALRTLPLTNAITIERFWDGYLTLHGLANLTTLEDMFALREVNYKWDAFEADGAIATARTALLNTAEDHSLYDTHLAADTDYIAINATAGKTLVIETYCPTNAADTFLTLYDSAYNPITTNDDIGNSTDPECAVNKYSAFSSKIQYPIANTNTYYIGVSAASDAGTTDTGRYGSYRLRINSY